MAKKPNTCGVCGTLLKKGVISLEGKQFCCKECCDTYKKRKKKDKKTCEFC